MVYGEVYVPDRKDKDGNFMAAETIEKMAHDFMKNKDYVLKKNAPAPMV